MRCEKLYPTNPNRNLQSIRHLPTFSLLVKSVLVPLLQKRDENFIIYTDIAANTIESLIVIEPGERRKHDHNHYNNNLAGSK